VGPYEKALTIVLGLSLVSSRCYVGESPPGICGQLSSFNRSEERDLVRDIRAPKYPSVKRGRNQWCKMSQSMRSLMYAQSYKICIQRLYKRANCMALFCL
jgi:hypothetical protein